MTDEELKQDRDLASAAIVGPWMATPDDDDNWTVHDGNGLWVCVVGKDQGSAKAIAAARTRWLAALDEIERLKRRIRAIAPVMLTVSALLNDEANEKDLREIAIECGERFPDDDFLTFWLAAAKESEESLR